MMLSKSAKLELGRPASGEMANPATKDQVPPIDLLWVKGSQGGNYYYSFGGNHRLEAHYRMGCTTIRAKLIQATPLALASYLGGSTPDLK
ncbi:sulfiredoxin-1, putative [Ixodes scapularis]|uniref:sulfiredoxin n=1 Tax=Ixodes scapularis TaxID=6945 RepID=B7Q5U0_IXOSC|nr:sulfiredoxin-1, putative [Ixodes scapularis]|eukprot:XP_002411813.1 sulfiredoxin-1, putative [Ixodes scapularis]